MNPDAIVPKREVKFVVSQEEELTTFQPDVPGLLDQRYAVSFTLAIKFTDWGSRGGFQSAPEEVGEILRNGPVRGLMDGSANLSGLIDRVPQHRLPPAAVLADVRRANRFVRLGFTGGPGDTTTTTYVTLLAQSPQQAETLARAAITLIDYGWLARAYSRYAAAAAYLQRWLPENREKLEKGTRELFGVQKQIDAMGEQAGLRSPPSRSELANLRSQLQLVAVDMAGARARVEACAKILKRKDLNPSRIDQVETLKTAAEIELIGLAAKEEALKGLLQKTSHYNSLFQQALRLNIELRGPKESISAAEARLAALRTILEPKTFFGQVVGEEQGNQVPGTIFIRKIKWVEPKRSDPPPAQPARR